MDKKRARRGKRGAKGEDKSNVVKPRPSVLEKGYDDVTMGSRLANLGR